MDIRQPDGKHVTWNKKSRANQLAYGALLNPASLVTVCGQPRASRLVSTAHFVVLTIPPWEGSGFSSPFSQRKARPEKAEALPKATPSVNWGVKGKPGPRLLVFLPPPALLQSVPIVRSFQRELWLGREVAFWH